MENKLWIRNVYSRIYTITGMILGLHPANGRRRYKVTASLIGCAQTYNQPCDYKFMEDVYPHCWFGYYAILLQLVQRNLQLQMIATTYK